MTWCSSAELSFQNSNVSGPAAATQLKRTREGRAGAHLFPCHHAPEQHIHMCTHHVRRNISPSMRVRSLSRAPRLQNSPATRATIHSTSTIARQGGRRKSAAAASPLRPCRWLPRPLTAAHPDGIRKRCVSGVPAMLFALQAVQSVTVSAAQNEPAQI
jgi:hypothetical protein